MTHPLDLPPEEQRRLRELCPWLFINYRDSGRYTRSSDTLPTKKRNSSSDAGKSSGCGDCGGCKGSCH